MTGVRAVRHAPVRRHRLLVAVPVARALVPASCGAIPPAPAASPPSSSSAAPTASAPAGHEPCDRSRDHDLTTSHEGARYVDAEVTDGLAAVRHVALSGTPVRSSGQPGGLWDNDVVQAMDRDDLDPLRRSDDPRVVILMHDGGGDRSQTVEALRSLLRADVAAGGEPVLAPHLTLSARAAAPPR